MDGFVSMSLLPLPFVRVASIKKAELENCLAGRVMTNEIITVNPHINWPAYNSVAQPNNARQG